MFKQNAFGWKIFIGEEWANKKNNLTNHLACNTEKYFFQGEIK
jgi:hypothetical protein